MIKTMLNMFVGALVAASVSLALAVTGQPPVQGFQTPDGTWLLGVSGGQNFSYQYGITAHAGGTQAACLNLTPGIYLYQVDTVASSQDSVCLPFAVAGMNLNIRNNGASTLAIYGQPNNNLLTGAADTINGTAGSTNYGAPGLLTQTNVECFAAKNGAWSCVRGS
jgi:hypothetical protein